MRIYCVDAYLSHILALIAVSKIYQKRCFLSKNPIFFNYVFLGGATRFCIISIDNVGSVCYNK